MQSKGGNEKVVLVLILAAIQTVNGGNKTLEADEKNLLRGSPRGTFSNFSEIARSYGYIAEEHTVITKDEYILSVFRLPKGKNCKGPIRQPPVLLIHGLLMSADAWLDAGPSAGLAFLISDACYDLWVGNVRGNYYGRRHLRLDPDVDSEFWNFSSDEMGRFDIPATIDYMLNNTGSSEILYIGYSQGARVFFIMCSETSGYCDKVRAFISLAPAAIVTHTRSVPIRLLTEFYALKAPFLSGPRELEFTRQGGLIQGVSGFLCKNIVFADTVCRAVLSLIDSYDPGSVLTRTIQVLFDHFPAGTSAYNIAFYGQNAIVGRFQKYDYGPIRNLELYGSVQPSLYNLNRTAMPVIIIYGKNDFLVDPKDVQLLSSQFPNLVESYLVERSTWNHLDVCYSQFIKQLIFPKVSQYLQNYSVVGTT